MKKYIFLAVMLCMAGIMQGQKLLVFKNNKGLYGYKDKAGKVIVDPKYNIKPTDFLEGRSVFTLVNLKGVLDENGKEIVPPVYKSISNFNYGYAVATKEVTDSLAVNSGKPNKYEVKGIIDREGKEIVPVQYRNIDGDFSNGWFVKVSNDFKEKIYYNTSGKIFTVPEGLFLDIQRIDGKRYVAMKNGNAGIINQQYKEILPFEYSSIRPTENDMLIVRKNNLDGLMDSKLKWVIQPSFKRIYLFEKGYAVFEGEDGLLGAINAKGVVTTKPQFATIYRISQTNSALAMFKNKSSDMSGVVDLATGQIVVPANYYFTTYNYSDGYIIFKRSNKKGIMDSTGKEVFYDLYDDFSSGFLEDRAWVKKDGKYGFIDKQGKLVIPIQYDNIGGFAEGMARVQQNGKYGFLDKNGNTAIPFKFKNAGSFEMGIAWVVDDNNKAFYIDKNGNEVK